jgi:hypothetical protein
MSESAFLEELAGQVSGLSDLAAQQQLGSLEALLAPGSEPRLGTGGQPFASQAPIDYSATAADQIDVMGGATSGIQAGAPWKGNLLADPMMEQGAEHNPIPSAPAPAAWEQWQAHYVLNSGTVPTGRLWSPVAWDVTNVSANFTNSHMGILRVEPDAGVACNVDFFIRAVNGVTPANAATYAAYLLGAFRIGSSSSGDLTGVTSITVTVQLVNSTGTVLAESVPVDFKAFWTANPAFTTQRVVAILKDPTAVATYLRLKVNMVMTSAVTASTLVAVTLAEPQQVYSSTPQPPVFVPVAGLWQVGRLASAPGGVPRTVAREGDVAWDSLRKLLMMWDGAEQRGIGHVGFAPFAMPPGLNPQSALTAGAIAANGGSAMIPMLVPSHMLLGDMVIWNTDTATARSLEWRLYEDRNNASTSLDEVAGANGTLSWTPAAAALRASTATGAPLYLAPGMYYLVIRNTHATNSLGVGIEAAGTAAITNHRSKTIGTALGATLDAATGWTVQTVMVWCRLRGEVWASGGVW